MAFHSGLVSVSFRKNSVDEILAACRAAGLEWIEWGSDVHVPVGNLAHAAEVAEKTRAAGMTVRTYGSYFRVGATPVAEFPAYVETAKQLGAGLIRVWGGVKGREAMSAEEIARVVADGKEIARMAGDAGLTVTLECHLGTVTNEYHSALTYLGEVDDGAMRMYWQPNQLCDEPYNLDAATALAPYTECLHVFQWDDHARYPLAAGEAVWTKYLNVFRAEAEKREIGLLLEFMHDDRLETLRETAQTLHRFMGKGSGGF